MQAKDTSHLIAIRDRLAREKARYAANPCEMRRVWVAATERELAQEEQFLGIEPASSLPQMTDDELLAALAS
jgi:hypothetical protein